MFYSIALYENDTLLYEAFLGSIEVTSTYWVEPATELSLKHIMSWNDMLDETSYDWSINDSNRINEFNLEVKAIKNYWESNSSNKYKASEQFFSRIKEVQKCINKALNSENGKATLHFLG